MNFLCRTIADQSQVGKQRVYFCAHPDDVHLLDQYAKLILHHQDCAVWYDDDQTADFDEAELQTILSQMQLFVVPVTHNFLFEPCRALGVDFAYARKNNIPILPILRSDEPGLVEEFNKLCGELHVLRDIDGDPSARDFDEKVGEFLGAVLLGDDLAEKIRDAFDAYIFLSYRKVDRCAALDLMKLIHENKFCRDISVWYDEFLTPGEDFNESIREALDNCSLFLISVTPNVVGEQNYILTTEFPAACDAGINILAVDMAETDRGLVAEKFPNVSFVSADDPKALTAALREKLKPIIESGLDNSPEHTYLVGLAYLNGIFMETDRKKAVRLIEKAAKAGLTDAMRKLAEIYRHGIGVAKNMQLYAVWMQRLINALEKGFYDTLSEETLMLLSKEIENYGEYLTTDENYEQAQKFYRRLYTCARTFNETQGQTAFAVMIVALCLGAIGKLEGKQGFTSQAKRYLKEADRLINELLVSVDFEMAAQGSAAARATITRQLSIVYDELAKLAHREKKFEEEAKYCALSLAICEQNIETADSTLSRIDLAVSLRDSGIVAYNSHDYDRAKDAFTRANEIYAEIGEEELNITQRTNWGTVYQFLGLIAVTEKDENAAHDYLKEAVRIHLSAYHTESSAGLRRECTISLLMALRSAGMCELSVDCSMYQAMLEYLWPDGDMPDPREFFASEGIDP